MAKQKPEPIKIELELNRDGTSTCTILHANPIEQTWATTHIDRIEQEWQSAAREAAAEKRALAS